MRWLALCLVVCACRYGFDAVDDAHGGPACGQPVPTTGAIAGTLMAATSADDSSPTCGGEGVTEDVYTIDVPVDGSELVVASDGDLGSSIDTTLYVRTGCEASSTEVACDTDSGINSAAAIRVPVQAGRYYVSIDGEGGATGAYHGTLWVLLPPGAPCDGGSFRDRCAPDYGCAGTCVPANCALSGDLTGVLSYQRTADTSTAANFHAGTCGSGHDGGVRAPELIYRLVLAAAASNVRVSTVSPNTDYDTLVYIRDACAGVEIACNDDANIGMATANDSQLDTGPLAAGDYFIFVDGFATRSGTADLTVTVTP